MTVAERTGADLVRFWHVFHYEWFAHESTELTEQEYGALTDEVSRCEEEYEDILVIALCRELTCS